MYMPPAFREDRLEALHEVMRRNPLATLITAAAGLAANHVPMLIDPEGGSKGLGVLRAHLARANAQTKLAGEVDALVLFLEVDHYVTPSWYETKRQTGRVVPTWNYVAVHATGRLRVVDDPAWLRRQIEALTAEHEGRRATPWAVSDAPEDFVVAQMRAIVGIEIDILDLQGKWKLSQNRTEADRRGVADGLGREDDASGRIMAGLIDRGNPT
ncbi:MAG TPA: FMN-binding negative transcriptional regulator [Lichenihabitans sp.]|nr:FMN-binding negative transcriptional regulator [Lichenihabitans sp.]